MLDFITKRLARNKVTVLLFHKVPAAIDPMAPNESDLQAFERVLDFVCRRYRVIPLHDAMSALQTNTLPSSSVCITFDDGYVDWVSGVLPLLESRQAHATFFMTTGQFDGLPLWHERIRNAVQHTKLPFSGGHAVGSLAEKVKTVALLEHDLKYMPLSLREERLQTLEAEAGVTPQQVSRMSAEQVRHVHNRGFGIGAHTVGHPILSLCSDAEARYELGAAKETLESVIGGAVTSLAYPNGRQRDFTDAHVKLAQELGYTSAVTTEPGVMTHGSSRFHVPRFTPWGPDPLRMFIQMSRNLLHPTDTIESMVRGKHTQAEEGR